MSDVGFFIIDQIFDLKIENGDLASDDGLETAVAISLFTDKRVTDEELPQFEESKRGWWGDIFPDVDQDKIGSRLWTLSREKRNSEALRRHEDLANEALRWLIEDNIADTININAAFDESLFLILEIEIIRPAEQETRFSVIWDKQEIRRVA